MSWPEWPTGTDCNIVPPVREYLSDEATQIPIARNHSKCPPQAVVIESEVRTAPASGKCAFAEAHQIAEITMVAPDFLPAGRHP